MNDSLRPMNLGAILDRAVLIFRQQPMLFFGLAAIPGIVQMSTSLATQHIGPDRTVRAAAGLISIVFRIAYIVVRAMSTGALCLAASAVNFGGTSTVGDAFNAFSTRKGRLVGLELQQGFFTFWPLIIVGFISAMLALRSGTGPGAIPVQVCLWTLGAIPCLVLYPRYLLAFPATAIEGLPASAAIDRSLALSEGGRMRILLGVLVPSVPMLVVVFGSSALIVHFMASFALLAGSPWTATVVESLVLLIATLVFSPYSAIVLTLLYYDQRIRREGYDVERMMDAAGLNPNAAETAAPLPVSVLEAGPAFAPEGNQQA